MFSDELAVVISRSNGSVESYFVPAEKVEKRHNRVQVAVRDAGSLVWATLPTPEPVTIPVNRSRIATT